MASIAEELEAAQTIYKEYLRCKQESEDLAEIASKHLMDAVDHLERAGNSKLYDAAIRQKAGDLSKQSPKHHGLLNKESNMDQSDHDPVNHPSHYTAYKGLEVIDFTEQMNFNRGNAVKYICRAGLKTEGAYEIQDLLKAIWYLQREIMRIRGQDVN